MLDLAAAEPSEGGANDRVVLANEAHGRTIAQTLRDASGVNHVGEEDRSEGALDVGLTGWVRVKPTEEVANAGLINLDDL